MSGFALELGAESFRIVASGGEESDLTDYGDVATLYSGDERYVAMVPQAEDGEGPAPEADWDDFEGTVFRLIEEETETREVQFEILADDDEEPGEVEEAAAAGSGA